MPVIVVVELETGRVVVIVVVEEIVVVLLKVTVKRPSLNIVVVQV